MKLKDYIGEDLMNKLHSVRDKLDQQKGNITKLESSIIRTNMAKDKDLYTKFMNMSGIDKQAFRKDYMRLFDFYAGYMIHNMADFKTFFKTQYEKDKESFQS